MSDPIPLTASPRASHPGAAWRRSDSYWDGTWAEGSTASWTSAALARRQEAHFAVTLPPAWQMGTEEALDIVTNPARRAQVVQALGALDQWRTMSAAQLAALTGRAVLGSPFTSVHTSSAVLAALFTLGLLDFGHPTAGLLSRSPSTSGTLLYHPSGVKTFDRLIAPMLTWAELLAVTGGLPFARAHQYDRHNTLAVELAMRVAELCEVGTVVGEKFSLLDALAHTFDGRTPTPPSTSQADFTIVRADGVRIAVELTASASAMFPHKVERWARLLESAPFSSCGLLVCFVCAAPPDRPDPRGERLRALVKRQVSHYAGTNPGSAADRTAARMAVAEWTDWFPASGLFTPAFRSLRAQVPTGASGSTWQPVDLLDPFEVPAPDNPALTRVIATSWALAGTPDILVPDAAPGLDLTPLALDSLGLRADVSPPPTRAPRRKGTGAGTGAVGDARVPPRLSWSPRADRPLPPVQRASAAAPPH